MTIDELLDECGKDSRYSAMLALSQDLVYPGKLPAAREKILLALDVWDMHVNEWFERTILDFDDKKRPLSEQDVYILAQRYACAADFLTRLADSLSTPELLSVGNLPPDMRDSWLLVGIWREYGQVWRQNLAWRLVNGLERFQQQ